MSNLREHLRRLMLASALLSAPRAGWRGWAGGLTTVRSSSPAVIFASAFSASPPPNKRPLRLSKPSARSASASSLPSSLSPSSSQTHEPQRTTIPPVPVPLPSPPVPALKANILTMPLPELELLLQSWNQPKYRASQIQNWIRNHGATSFDAMANLPKSLRTLLNANARIGALDLEVEMVSKDGTIKRAYRLWDGQLIESVLMPYERDGRNTACVSSQAGCAMGCVFCATGQMGFARQLTAEEIFEQVVKFDSELKGRGERLSNVVMMGMGEPLANYRNVMTAIRRMNDELGIGARKITVSTVGVVPSIRKLMADDLQVRLAVSLHCSDDEERSALLPANKRYGGLDELMSTVREYIDTTRRRVTFEWALIENSNDTPEVARKLGRLLKRHGIRRDMAHVNIIPLNPTGGFEGGRPSGRTSVERFRRVLEDEFGISATPRMRRGIDIEAGCGQLKAAVKKREEAAAAKKEGGGGEEENVEDAAAVAVGNDTAGEELRSFMEQSSPEEVLPRSPLVGVYEDEEEDDDDNNKEGDNDGLVVQQTLGGGDTDPPSTTVEFSIHDSATLDLDEEDGEIMDEAFDEEDAARLVDLVRSSFRRSLKDAAVSSSNGGVAGGSSSSAISDDVYVCDDDDSPVKGETTTITDVEAERKAKRRRKKLVKNLRMIDKLRGMESGGKVVLNEEQIAKVAREEEWKAEIESIEHNLK